MKADKYRYWQGRPVQERMDAVSEMTLAAYAMKGAAPDVARFQRTVMWFSFHTQPRFTKNLGKLRRFPHRHHIRSGH